MDKTKLKQGIINTSFADISYLHSVNNGPTIVFIHGASGCKEMFIKQFNFFEQKYDLFTFDLPGHGKSSNSLIDPEKCYTISSYAKCLKEALDHLKIGKIILCGNSLGGHVALDFASLYPENVLGIMINGTPPVAPGQEGKQGFLMNIDFFENCPDFPDMTEEEAKAFFLSSVFVKGGDFVLEANKRAVGKARSIMMRSFLKGEGIDERQFVETSNIPIAIATGINDPLINHKYIEELKYKNLYKNEKFECGHCAFWEQPEKFNEFLEEFYKFVNSKN